MYRLLTYFSRSFLFLRVCSFLFYFLLKLSIPLKCLNRKKKTFTVSESKCESHQGNLMEKKTLPRGKHNDFSSISSSNKRTTSEKEFWKIKGIHLGSIVGPLNVGYRFSTLVWEVLNERPRQIFLKQKTLVNQLMHLKNYKFSRKQVKLRKRVLKRWLVVISLFIVLSIYLTFGNFTKISTTALPLCLTFRSEKKNSVLRKWKISAHTFPLSLS